MSYNCISGVPVRYRGQFYASMGMMFVQSDTNLAKKFFKEGLKYKDAMNYLGLSMLSYIDNDYVAVDSFLNRALFFADKKQKTFIYENMRQITSSNRDYKSAYEYLCKYDDLVAKNNKEQAESIANTVQVQLDQSLKELEMQKNIFLLLSVIITSSVLFIVFRLRHYTMKMKKEKLQYYAMLNLYKNKLKELERQSADKHNRSYEEEIRRRIKKYETQQTQKLNTGHALYISILEKGKNTITWNKKEYESFLKYCKLKEFYYMLQLETDYEGLSPRDQFFIVLQHLGKSEKDIQRIMVISQGAIRTIKSRIRGCKKV